MEKIKKYSYYLFIYALFAFWLIYFSQILLAEIYFLKEFINYYIEKPTIQMLYILILSLILGPVSIVFYCLAPRYFMRIKNKETAKIKDIVLAVIYTFLGFLSCCITVFMIFDVFWNDY